jgi:ECF transporter S component (folate family)
LISTKKLVISSLLIALAVVLTRILAINTMIVKVGFGFIPIVIAAIYLGPLYAAIICALEDVIGTSLIVLAPLNPLITITAFLTGLAYGVFLYPSSHVCIGIKKFGRNVARIFHVKEHNLDSVSNFILAFITGTVVSILFSLVANTLIIHYYFGFSYAVLIPTRLIKTIILIPLHTVMIPLISEKLIPQLKKLPSF